MKLNSRFGHPTVRSGRAQPSIIDSSQVVTVKQRFLVPTWSLELSHTTLNTLTFSRLDRLPASYVTYHLPLLPAYLMLDRSGACSGQQQEILSHSSSCRGVAGVSWIGPCQRFVTRHTHC